MPPGAPQPADRGGGGAQEGGGAGTGHTTPTALLEGVILVDNPKPDPWDPTRESPGCWTRASCILENQGSVLDLRIRNLNAGVGLTTSGGGRRTDRIATTGQHQGLHNSDYYYVILCRVIVFQDNATF